MSAIATLAACGKHNAPTTKTARTHAPVSRGGGPVTLVTATETVAKERCMRETRCDRVGAGRRFADEKVCQNAFAMEERKVMRTNTCESGYIDPEGLLDCLEAIRSSGCAGDAQTACEASTMCSP